MTLPTLPLRLSNDQLARLRADILTLLPGTAIIQSAATISDGAGGFGETWTAVTGGTVPCRVDRLNRSTQINTAGEAEAVVIDYSVLLPYDAPAVVGNRLLIGGQPYEIRRLADESSWLVAKQCLVARVR